MQTLAADTTSGSYKKLSRFMRGKGAIFFLILALLRKSDIGEPKTTMDTPGLRET